MRTVIEMLRRRMRFWVVALAVLVVAASLIAPQETHPAASQQAQDRPLVLRSETNLILVPFHVVRKDHYADDIGMDDITLLEDGVPQKIALLEGGAMAGRTVPVDVILVFDKSGSVMNAGLLDLVAFKESLLDGLSYTRLGIYAFSNKLRCYAQPTRDVSALELGLSASWAAMPAGRPVPFGDPKHVGSGGTLLYESIMQAIRDVSAMPGNATRSLLVFSDSFSTSTKANAKDAVNAAQTHGVSLYPVLLGHERLLAKEHTAQQRAINNSRNPAARAGLANIDDKERQMAEFASMGALTGGRSFDPREINSQTLRTILLMLVNQIRTEYVAGYYLERTSATRKPHRAEVRLVSKDKGKITGGFRTILY